jgi:hypothetical protein
MAADGKPEMARKQRDSQADLDCCPTQVVFLQFQGVRGGIRGSYHLMTVGSTRRYTTGPRRPGKYFRWTSNAEERCTHELRSRNFLLHKWATILLEMLFLPQSCSLYPLAIQLPLLIFCTATRHRGTCGMKVQPPITPTSGRGVLARLERGSSATERPYA